jgi:acyl-CoA synthetase (NDP forming)
MSETPADILAAAMAEGREALLEHEVYAIARCAGLDVPRHHFWRGAPGETVTGEVSRFLSGLPSEEVVLKLVSPQVLHKSDVGGLAFCSREPRAVLAAARHLWEETAQRAAGVDRLGILVLEKLATVQGTLAAEVLLSVKQDPAFGTVLVLGLGGVLTEWLSDLSGGTSTIVVQPGHVREALEEAAGHLPALALLFRESRLHGEPPLKLDEVARKLETLGRLAVSLGPERGEANGATLEELEINPVLLTTDGRWVAADGTGRLSKRRVTRGTRPLQNIDSLLSPRSAAVLGASATSLNPGRIILRNLKVAEGITYGHLYAVHPTETSIDGVPAVSSPAGLPETVDLAVVALPAASARDAIVSLCRSFRARSIILISGGFAETGRRDLADEIVAALSAARATPQGGPVLLGGNCLGIVSKHQYNTFFLPQYKLPFHDAPGDRLVAISQSGAYLTSLTSNLDGVVFPRASISYGNQMDLTLADFMEYFEGDDSVSVLACYIEGFTPLDGERFVNVARRLREKGKRVIAFKAGKTALGAEAARSHTASLAGDYAVARALMEHSGVIVAQTLNMFEDYTKIFAMLEARRPAGRRLGVLSNAGFECAAVLDKMYQLDKAVLSAATRDRLTACLPNIAHPDNPVDTTPMAVTKQFVEAAAALLEDPGVDLLLVSPIPVTPQLDNLAPDLSGAHTENIFSPGSLAQELLRLFRATKKPMVVNVDSGRLYDDFVMVLQRGGIPVYRKIDRASRALSAICTA